MYKYTEVTDVSAASICHDQMQGTDPKWKTPKKCSIVNSPYWRVCSLSNRQVLKKLSQAVWNKWIYPLKNQVFFTLSFSLTGVSVSVLLREARTWSPLSTLRTPSALPETLLRGLKPCENNCWASQICFICARWNSYQILALLTGPLSSKGGKCNFLA